MCFLFQPTIQKKWRNWVYIIQKKLTRAKAKIEQRSAFVWTWVEQEFNQSWFLSSGGLEKGTKKKRKKINSCLHFSSTQVQTKVDRCSTFFNPLRRDVFVFWILDFGTLDIIPLVPTLNPTTTDMCLVSV